MSEAVGTTDSSLERSAAETLRSDRLRGTCRLLDALEGHVSLTAQEHRVYLMAWQAAHVLAPRLCDAAGRWARRPGAGSDVEAGDRTTRR